MAETKEPRGKLHLYLRQPVRKKERCRIKWKKNQKEGKTVGAECKW